MGIFNKKQSNTRKRPSSEASVPSANRSVYAYHQNRSVRENSTGRKVESSEKTEKRNKQRAIQHIPTLLLVIAVAISLFYISTLDPSPKIILIDGQEVSKAVSLRDSSVYQVAAQDYIKGSIVNRSKFLIDSDGLSRELKSQFPEIAVATVTLPIMGRRPVIELQATQPAFILTSGSTSMLIGSNGIALVDVKDASDVGSLNLRAVSDESGVKLEAGKPALPQEQAQFIAIIVEQLEKQGYTIESLTIPKSAYDLNVRITGKGYYGKFNILEDPLQQAGSFIALSKKLEAAKTPPSEYIDVRVGERVFYR